MEYRTVYEIGYYNLTNYNVILICIIAIPVLIFAFVKEADGFRKMGIAAFTAFLVLVTIFITYVSIYEQIKCIELLRTEKCQVVEGTVEDFIPMPYHGHADESFRVKDVKFRYSDYGSEVGFNNSRSHGGPIYPGRWVKIYFVDHKILKAIVKNSDGVDNRILKLIVKKSEDDKLDTALASITPNITQ